MSSKHMFTPETARTFEHGESIPHTVILAMAAQERGCECAAYEDWFTLKRWNALGFRVRKGERSVTLATFRTVQDRDNPRKTVTIPWRSHVFCRCQVDPKG